MLLRLLLHQTPPWIFLPPAIVFAWGCALEKLAVGLDRLLAVHDRFTGGERDDAHH